ncbi:MAG: hypothetical protein HN392_09415 [Anaerolineae bacterium]|nr:hypothetical protein [Anaerolineae bacterium]MBT7988784.1 hypothetical protein [Anaerolineae bacterium]
MLYTRASTTHDRSAPLNAQGRKDALKMGKVLAAEGVKVDAVLCSTAQRTRETLKEFSFEGAPRYLDRLYTAELRDYLDMLMQLSPDIEVAVIVGHNPTIASALEFFTERYKAFSPASIALIEFEIEKWDTLIENPVGKLLEYWIPENL